MHPEMIGDCLQGVIAGGVGGDHCGLGISMFGLIVVQGLGYGATLCTRDFSDGGLVRHRLHAFEEPVRAEEHLAAELLPHAWQSDSGTDKVDIQVDRPSALR